MEDGEFAPHEQILHFFIFFSLATVTRNAKRRLYEVNTKELMETSTSF